MRKIAFIFFSLFSQLCFLQSAEANTLINSESEMPNTLYKILSCENWEKSQGQQCLLLDKGDEAFIHLALEHQLDRIISKYWKDAPQFVILTIDTNKLQGNLIYEANPGGENKYYHLYDGCIPLTSIIDFQIIRRN